MMIRLGTKTPSGSVSLKGVSCSGHFARSHFQENGKSASLEHDIALFVAGIPVRGENKGRASENTMFPRSFMQLSMGCFISRVMEIRAQASPCFIVSSAPI